MKSIIYLDQCGSTNDEIKAFAMINEMAFSSVYTFHQTNGRGQYSKKWQSDKNKNLAFSFAFPLHSSVLTAIQINFYTALLLSEFIANMSDILPQIKWPNDLIIKKKKVSGMLIEEMKNEKGQYYIIGIGLNVLQTDFSELPKAGSLLTQTNKAFDLHSVANALHDFFCEKFSETIDERLILENYNANLFGKNKVSVFEIDGIRQNGIIRKVDAEGFLWVELDDEKWHRFFHKEIEMLY